MVYRKGEEGRATTEKIWNKALANFSRRFNACEYWR